MPDPSEELSNFEPGVPVNPMPASEVRRRGDRLRRRNTTFVVGGAVAAIVLIAAPIAVLSGDDEKSGSVGPADQPLTSDVLLTADEVPARERLTAWEEITAEGRTLACAPAAPAALDADSSVRRDFGADVAEAPGPEGEPPVSVVRTEVLQFADEATAREEYDQTQGWVLGCPGGDDIARKGVTTSRVTIDGGQGEWRAHEFYAPDACTDCDAIRFDRMGVAQFGDRVVLVSLAEVGGPLEPEGLDQSMDALFEAAVVKAGGVVTTGSTSPPGPAIPDSFPLAEGLPSEGREGPSRDLDTAPYNLEGAFTACNSTMADLPEASDTLYAGSRAASTANLRELMTFASPQVAQRFVDAVAGVFASCPNDVDDQGVGKIYELSEVSDYGDYGVATVMRLELDGQPAPGAQVVLAVRSGQSVLLSLINDEATTLSGDTDAVQLGFDALVAARAVIDAM
jgi:hypothetical protein